MTILNSTAYNEKLMNFALLILRVFVGCAMLTHGIPKMMKLFSGEEVQFMNFLGLGTEISLGLTVLQKLSVPFF
jgi:putative oxidoreductase